MHWHKHFNAGTDKTRQDNMRWWKWRNKQQPQLLSPPKSKEKNSPQQTPPPPPPPLLLLQQNQGMPDDGNQKLLSSFTPIFYACKFFGIYPFKFDAFRQHQILQPSRSGSFVVFLVLLALQFGYGYMTYTFRNPTAAFSKSYLGNIVIAAVISLAPLILLADQLNALHRQRSLGKIFAQIDELDAHFHGAQITDLRNGDITKRIRIMIGMTLLFELLIFMATFLLLPDVGQYSYITLWILNFVPTLYNTFDKIWFVGLALAMQRRFAAINGVLETMVAQHEHLQEYKTKALIEEIIPVRQPLSKPIFWHIDSNVTNYEDFLRQDLASVHKPFKRNAVKFVSELDSDHADIEDKFMQLCQLHSDICELINRLQRHWSIPTLCLMAYIFVMTIAQLYFTYLAQQEDEVPTLFVSTKSSVTTILLLVYLYGKCVLMMYCCWITKLEARRTAICMHRCAVATNRNEIYETVNHLSLKLFNHPVNFSAGGFFSLEMSTIYGMLGGLASYLIIFIQFDLEAKQQVQRANQSTHGN